MDEKEVVEKMDEWRNQIVQLTTDYNEAIGKLKDVKDFVKDKEEKIWATYKIPIYCGFFVILIVSSLIIIDKYTSWCGLDFEFSDTKVSVINKCDR